MAQDQFITQNKQSRQGISRPSPTRPDSLATCMEVQNTGMHGNYLRSIKAD